MNLFQIKSPKPETPLPTLEEMTDILDIEDIISFAWDKLFSAAALILFIVTLLVFAFFILRWWLKKRAHENRDELLPPHKKVFLELERLDKQKLIERGDFRKYYFFLSEIFRRYIDERFGYPALDKTTYEILPALKEFVGHSDRLGKIAESFFYNADMVKFAKHFPGEKAAHEEKERVIKFVKATIPVARETSTGAERPKSDV